MPSSRTACTATGTSGAAVQSASALLAISAFTRSPLPRDPRVWGHLLVVALLLCVLPFSLFARAEQHVSSGLASILNATTPLMTMIVALVALPQERRLAIACWG